MGDAADIDPAATGPTRPVGFLFREIGAADAWRTRTADVLDLLDLEEVSEIVGRESGNARRFDERQRLVGDGREHAFQLHRGELPQSSGVGITEVGEELGPLAPRREQRVGRWGRGAVYLYRC